MVPAATTVGGYLQSLPNDRRVAMARVCSMIRRSARGVRESMRFGLAFYEAWKGLDAEHRCVEFRDLNCLPLDVVEGIVRNSLKLRRARPANEMPSQTELLEIWGIREEDAAVAPPIVRIVVNHDEEAQGEQSADAAAK